MRCHVSPQEMMDPQKSDFLMSTNLKEEKKLVGEQSYDEQLIPPRVVAVQGDEDERTPQHESDDESEDEFIEVSILDGLSIEELPPPTTLFREEGDRLIEVSIFGISPEREHPHPPTRDEGLNVRRKVKEEDESEVSLSLPVLPNPPQIDAQSDSDEPPSFSFKVEIKTEEEEEEPQREGSDDGGGEIEVSLFRAPHEYISPKVEGKEVAPNSEHIPPPTATRDEEFEEKDESDSEYFPHPKEEESFEPDEEKAKRRRTPTRKRKKKRKKQKPHWTSSQFPTEKDEEGEYYCADCDRGSKIFHCRNCTRKCWCWCKGKECEGYYSRGHKCFKSLPRRHRPRWKSDLFPSEKNTAGEYYCADCERGNDIKKCRNCERECWKWCDGEKCEEKGYKTCGRHKCFQPKKKRKQKPKWKSSDFPQKKEGNYYCGDCDSSNETYRCSECGRVCWKWCQKCREYRSNAHFPCRGKKKRKKKRKREEKKPEKEVEKLEPSKKKRKLE